MKAELLRRMDVKPRLASGDAVHTVIMGGSNADTVDGIDADRVPRPNKLLALDANGQFPTTAIPWPRAEAVHGFGGRTIFGPGATHLVADIDAATTSVDVYEPVWAVGEYLLWQPALAAGEKMKVTAGPTFIGPGRYRYTVTRNVDGLGAQSFNRNQLGVSIGALGQGYIAIDAQGHKSYRPFIDVIYRSEDTPGGAYTKARIGLLDGITENGIDPVLAPRGWGIWTDNGYFRGVLNVLGNSRIYGELAVGYPLGPEMRIRRRALPNGQTVHGLEWLYEPNRRWWVQWFNETNRRVFWTVRKPQSADGTKPEEDLITLQYRPGDPDLGEPPGDDYFLNIAAKTIIGDLVAGRVRITGALSAAVADFGEISSGALRLSGWDFATPANRDGLYAWNGWLPWQWVRADETDFAGASFERGFEFWKSGVLQGRLDYELGALIFGPPPAVNADGRLFLRRTQMGFDVLPGFGWRGAGDTGAPGFYWWERETGLPMGRTMFGRRQQQNPTTGEDEEIERYLWLESFYKAADIANGIALAAWGATDATTAQLILASGSPGGRMAAATLAGDLIGFRSSLGNTFMQMREATGIEFGNFAVSLLGSSLLPPPLARVTQPGTWGAGPDENGYITLGAYSDATNGLIRIAIDPATKAVKVKVGNDAWQGVATS